MEVIFFFSITLSKKFAKEIIVIVWRRERERDFFNLFLQYFTAISVFAIKTIRAINLREKINPCIIFEEGEFESKCVCLIGLIIIWKIMLHKWKIEIAKIDNRVPTEFVKRIFYSF